MKSKIKKFFIGHAFKITLLSLVLIFIFSYGFSKIEGVDFFDSIYWAITTSTTVGYGDFSPTTPVGKIFTMFVMITGIGLMGYILSEISNHIVAGNMQKFLGTIKSKKKNHTIILGWNPFAKSVIEELVENNEDIVIVNSSPNPDILSYPKTQFVAGDLNESKTLINAGIKDAKTIILTMVEDSTVILNTSLIRKLNRNIVIAGRIDDNDYFDVAKEAGCDRVVSPSEIGGNLIYSAFHEPSIVKWISEVATNCYGAKMSEFKMRDNMEYVGKKISDIKVSDIKVLVAISKEGEIESIPDKDYSLKDTDTLIFVERNELVIEKAGIPIKSNKANDGEVLICGWNNSVKSAVEEIIKERKVSVISEDIAEDELEHYREMGIKIIKGRINKINLKKSGVGKIDNVILAMRDDSNVILISYLVKTLNPNCNLIGRIDDLSNILAARDAGINHVVSPSEIGGKLLVRSLDMEDAVKWIMRITTLKVGANINEVKAKDNKGFIGKKLSDLKLKDNQLILGLDRNSDSTVEVLPEKSYVLKSNDTLIVLEK